MKYAKVEHQGRQFWGEIVDDIIHELSEDEKGWAPNGTTASLDEVRLLAPLATHNKVIGLLDNFDGRKGRKGPGLFLKPQSAMIAHGDPIHWPAGVEQVTFEAELGVVIARSAKAVSEADALDCVGGYTITNDMTSFSVMAEDGQGSLSSRFKMYDDFMPIGPWIVTGLDPENLKLSSYLNDVLHQSASTADMAFSVRETIAWISSVMTLEPGDVISMGTPPGFAPMSRNDVVRCEIEGIGALENRLI